MGEETKPQPIRLMEGLCPYVEAVVNSCTLRFIEEPLVVYNQ